MDGLLEEDDFAVSWHKVPMTKDKYQALLEVPHATVLGVRPPRQYSLSLSLTHPVSATPLQIFLPTIVNCSCLQLTCQKTSEATRFSCLNKAFGDKRIVIQMAANVQIDWLLMFPGISSTDIFTKYQAKSTKYHGTRYECMHTSALFRYEISGIKLLY